MGAGCDGSCSRISRSPGITAGTVKAYVLPTPTDKAPQPTVTSCQPGRDPPARDRAERLEHLAGTSIRRHLDHQVLLAQQAHRLVLEGSPPHNLLLPPPIPAQQPPPPTAFSSRRSLPRRRLLSRRLRGRFFARDFRRRLRRHLLSLCGRRVVACIKGNRLRSTPSLRLAAHQVRHRNVHTCSIGTASTMGMAPSSGVAAGSGSALTGSAEAAESPVMSWSFASTVTTAPTGACSQPGAPGMHRQHAILTCSDR